MLTKLHKLSLELQLTNQKKYIRNYHVDFSSKKHWEIMRDSVINSNDGITNDLINLMVEDNIIILFVNIVISQYLKYN